MNPSLQLINKVCFYAAIAVALSAAPARLLGAETPQQEPLQMIVDYGQGPPKIRESNHGVVDPVGIPIGRAVSISLRFLRTRAGERIALRALDGGTLDFQQPAISSNGLVTFTFNPGQTTGLFRIFVYGGPTYEIDLYAFDPAASTAASRH